MHIDIQVHFCDFSGLFFNHILCLRHLIFCWSTMEITTQYWEHKKQRVESVNNGTEKNGVFIQQCLAKCIEHWYWWIERTRWLSGCQIERSIAALSKIMRIQFRPKKISLNTEFSFCSVFFSQQNGASIQIFSKKIPVSIEMRRFNHFHREFYLPSSFFVNSVCCMHSLLLHAHFMAGSCWI